MPSRPDRNTLAGIRADNFLRIRRDHATLRPVEYLADMLARDPFRAFRLPAGAKRMVTFLREPPQVKLALPLEVNGSRILALEESEIFAAYVPGPKGSAFLSRLEKAFGKEMTTRSWDTVRKCAAA